MKKILLALNIFLFFTSFAAAQSSSNILGFPLDKEEDSSDLSNNEIAARNRLNKAFQNVMKADPKAFSMQIQLKDFDPGVAVDPYPGPFGVYVAWGLKSPIPCYVIRMHLHYSIKDSTNNLRSNIGHFMGKTSKVIFEDHFYNFRNYIAEKFVDDPNDIDLDWGLAEMIISFQVKMHFSWVHDDMLVLSSGDVTVNNVIRELAKYRTYTFPLNMQEDNTGEKGKVLMNLYNTNN